MYKELMKWCRTSRSSSTVVSVGTSVTELTQRNAHRISLILQNHGANAVWVSPDPNIASGQGVRLDVPGSVGSRLELTLLEHGELVMRNLFAITVVGAVDVGVIEVSATED